MNQAFIPGLEAEPINPKEEPDDDFDWFRDEAVIVEQQRSIAVYRNARNHVVIRAEGEGYDADGDDKVILLSTSNALKALIVALQREMKEGI